MKSRSVAGFGLLQVMIGTVVLGIFAMVFVRKAYNRADVGLLTELITYRDQVLDYYAAVIQSRTAWECTRACNNGLPSSTSPVGFNLYDGDADCQSRNTCPSIPPTLRLPKLGWRFFNDLVFSPPSAFPTPPGDTNNPFLVKVEWQKTDATTRSSVKVTLSIDFSPTKVWREDYTTMDVGSRKRVFYMNRTPYKNCADGLAAARFGIKRFYSSETAGVPRYAGDTAVVAIDATTGLVECWNSPLVIPPCYRPNLPPFSSPSSSDADRVDRLDFVASQACGWADQGLCPQIGSGTTGVTHFDRFTGVSHCARNHILMVEENGVSGVDCGTTVRGKGGLVGVSNDGKFICSNDRTLGGTGVSHNETGSCPYGIQGWDQYGNVKCANRDWRGGVWESNIDYGANISFGDGYWVGDKGDKGCKGDSLRSCNCCEYPQHCTDSWVGCTTICVDIGNDDRNLKDEFRGCTSRACHSYNSACSKLGRCNNTCDDCLYGSISNGVRTGGRRGQYKPCRDYRNCLSNCSTCENDQNECSSDRSDLSSCENDENADCSSERTDLDDCLDSACSTECNCSDPGSCGILSDCSSECNILYDPDDTDNDTNNCRNKSIPRHSFFGTTTLGLTCDACNEYNRDCSTAKTESRRYKTTDRPTLIQNTSDNCSTYGHSRTKTSCP